METTILLSKVLGLYLIISGIIIMSRKEYFLPVFSVFVKEKMTRIILAFIELLAGLFLVVTHFDFSSLPASIISTFGVIAVLESIMYTVLSDRFFTKMLSYINRPAVYVLGGVFSIAVGLYLATYGFGIM